jgi:hypothetical protein
MNRRLPAALLVLACFAVWPTNSHGACPAAKECADMTGREMLRDKYGNRIGEIEIKGSKRTLRDKYGNRLGEYDSHNNWTRDRYGNPVGQGDLLATLLK